MVSENKIYCRIDRPTMVVRFSQFNENSLKVDSWIGLVNQTVELVDLVAEKVERRVTVE